MSRSIHIHDDLAVLRQVRDLHIVGRVARLQDAVPHLPAAARAVWSHMLEGDPGDFGRSTHTWLPDGGRVVVGILPERCSRHCSPSRSWTYPRLLGGSWADQAGLLVLLDDAAHARAAAAAVGRSFPGFNARSHPHRAPALPVVFLAPDGPVPARLLQPVLDAVQRAARWVDMPPNQLGPDAFVLAARAVAERTGAGLHVLRRAALQEQGFGGLVGVGRAARQEPALVVLDGGSGASMCWVGKGITYDTGGLSIKTKTGMPGMKSDMGGAAAVLAAFEAAMQLRVPRRLTAILCIAENAVGPDALRPDDILTLYSRRTVEVNNTDAEGRLVLADGVAWAVRHREPDVLIDIATLTGAQSVATGKHHGALYCNDEALERAAVAIGRATGDMVHPLPYAPELYRREFGSVVADMKNSVHDRKNAQPSCAAQFIANHLGPYTGRWLHIDMSGPSKIGQRGTGFGVNLLLGLAEEFVSDSVRSER